MTDLVAEISAVSDEQSAGIGQINQAIIQMDDVTQQNAALVEQAAAATEALEEQAQTLAQAVAAFKLRSAVASFVPVAPFSRGGAASPTTLSLVSRKKPVAQVLVAPDDDDWAAV